jgi:hypothetical protein
MDRFNLKKSNDVEVKEQYEFKISNCFTALENLDDVDNVGISRAWKSIKENVKASATESPDYYELKQHKPWFDEECSKLLYQRKQAKLQWIHNPSQINGDNLKNVRHGTSKPSVTKKRGCLKGKINELETNNKKSETYTQV